VVGRGRVLIWRTWRRGEAVVPWGAGVGAGGAGEGMIVGMNFCCSCRRLARKSKGEGNPGGVKKIKYQELNDWCFRLRCCTDGTTLCCTIVRSNKVDGFPFVLQCSNFMLFSNH
jgi:hypothetical protein